MDKGLHSFQKTENYEILILSMLLGISIVSCEYGPPISSLIRPTSLASSTQSPFLSMQNSVRYYAENVIELEDFPNYATVLPMAEGRSWIKSEELLEILGQESPNEGFIPFVVTPPEGHGMMVVIQELQIPAFNTFNQSLLVIDDNGRIMECFSKFVFQIEGKSPVQVCGRTNDQLLFRPSVIDGVGPRSFVVPVGKSITVGFIYRDEEIANSPSLSKQVPYYDMGYIFRASIAFTAYKDCPHGPPFYNENNEKLWPCDIPQSSREAVAACIREDLFCDNIINCGMHDSKEFAVDERFCKGKVVNGNNDSDSLPNQTGSHRKKQIQVDTIRLEDAIRNRIIQGRPLSYNEMMIQMGTHSSGKGSHFTPEPLGKPDTLGHPAFVALIVLITIICVLIIGLFFRYCCKPCVGKSDPFGGSSNPEAVARFHENLRSRDTDPNGQSSRVYGVTFENIFKPVEDLPPLYSDLFPEDVIDSRRNSHNKRHNSIESSPIGRSPDYEDSGIRAPSSSSVYSVPVTLVTQQETSHSVNNTNRNNGNQSYFVNPAFVHVEVLPGNRNSFEGRNDPISVPINNSDDDSLQRSNQNPLAYRVDST